jgi:soluble lytic murein transglycosylase-like protein
MKKISHSPRYLLNSLLLKMKHWVCDWMRHSVVALLMLGVILPAQADVWGYVDEKGVAHFAAEKLDARYELYFRGNTSFDTRDGLLPNAYSAETAKASPAAGAASAAARSAAVPAGKSKLLTFFEVSPNFKAVRHHMRESAQTYNIDFELLQALIATESGFDANAVSSKGAVGLMQLMPPTAQRYGVSGDAKTPIEKKLTDPKINIKAGSRYLRDLIKMFPGQLELALAAYNAGEGAVQRYGNKIPPFKETQNYVVTVMQIYRSLKPPSAVVQRQEARTAQQPGRVHMEFPNTPAQAAPGQISGRGNMVPPLSGAPTALPTPPQASVMPPAAAASQPFNEFK